MSFDCVHQVSASVCGDGGPLKPLRLRAEEPDRRTCGVPEDTTGSLGFAWRGDDTMDHYVGERIMSVETFFQHRGRFRS